jgi:hypothetical protein
MSGGSFVGGGSGGIRSERAGRQKSAREAR